MSYPGTSTSSRLAAPKPSNPWPWVALSVAIVAVAAVALASLLAGDEGGRSPGPDSRDTIARLIEPVNAANYGLSDELEALEPGDPAGPALGSVRAAARRSREAREQLGYLDLGADTRGLRLRTDRALAIELRYLARAASALRSSHATAGARAFERRTRTAWRLLARDVPGAGGRIAGVGALLAWVRAVPVDGDAGPGTSQPVLEDGDAGPGATRPDASSGAAQNAPDAPAVRHCGGFEGVFDIVAEGIDCQEAGDVAHGALTSKSAAGAGGFICTPGRRRRDGATRFTCDGPAGQRASFSAYIG